MRRDTCLLVVRSAEAGGGGGGASGVEVATTGISPAASRPLAARGRTPGPSGGFRGMPTHLLYDGRYRTPSTGDMYRTVFEVRWRLQHLCTRPEYCKQRSDRVVVVRKYPVDKYWDGCACDCSCVPCAFSYLELRRTKAHAFSCLVRCMHAQFTLSLWRKSCCETRSLSEGNLNVASTATRLVQIPCLVTVFWNPHYCTTSTF